MKRRSDKDEAVERRNDEMERLEEKANVLGDTKRSLRK